MYVHIYEIPEKFLKQDSHHESVPLRDMFINCIAEIQEKKRGQESFYLIVP